MKDGYVSSEEYFKGAIPYDFLLSDVGIEFHIKRDRPAASFDIYNKMVRSALKEISDYSGIVPMMTINEAIPKGTFHYLGCNDKKEAFAKKCIDSVEPYLKEAVKQAIEATSYSVPGLFISVDDDKLSKFNYNFKLNLDLDADQLSDSIGVDVATVGNDIPFTSLSLKTEMYSNIKKHLEFLYKNLIKYGFEVVANIKKKLNEGDNGYMPEQMMITRNPNMQQNGQFIVPTAPIFQPMGPEDIAANPDDRFKDQVMQPFVTLVGTAPIYETPANQGTNIQELETDKISERIIHMMA